MTDSKKLLILSRHLVRRTAVWGRVV